MIWCFHINALHADDNYDNLKCQFYDVYYHYDHGNSHYMLNAVIINGVNLDNDIMMIIIMRENSSLFQNDLKNKEGRLITLPVGALQPSKANQEYSTQAQTDGSFQGD